MLFIISKYRETDTTLRGIIFCFTSRAICGNCIEKDFVESVMTERQYDTTLLLYVHYILFVRQDT